MYFQCNYNKCYILDDNAYIISGLQSDQIGRFFGSVENNLMQILIENKIYKSTEFYDYQAVCYIDKNIAYESLYPLSQVSAASELLINPLRSLIAIFLNIASLFMETFAKAPMKNCKILFELKQNQLLYLIFSQIEFLPVLYPDPSDFYDEEIFNLKCLQMQQDYFKKCIERYWNDSGIIRGSFNFSDAEKDEDFYQECDRMQKKNYKKCVTEYWDIHMLQRHINRTLPQRCDKFSYIYELNKASFTGEEFSFDCERPFEVQRIPNTNLILLVINSKCQNVITNYEFYDEPRNILYNGSMFCRKTLNKQLYRMQSKYCFNQHDDVSFPFNIFLRLSLN